MVFNLWRVCHWPLIMIHQFLHLFCIIQIFLWKRCLSHYGLRFFIVRNFLFFDYFVPVGVGAENHFIFENWAKFNSLLCFWKWSHFNRILAYNPYILKILVNIEIFKIWQNSSILMKTHFFSHFCKNRLLSQNLHFSIFVDFKWRFHIFQPYLAFFAFYVQKGILNLDLVQIQSFRKNKKQSFYAIFTNLVDPKHAIRYHQYGRLKIWKGLDVENIFNIFFIKSVDFDLDFIFAKNSFPY